MPGQEDGGPAPPARPRTERHLDLPSDLTAAGVARDAVAELIDGPHQLKVHEFEATLLVSEVVTNAVLHGGGCLSLTFRVGAGWLRVEVHDGSRVAPGVRRYGRSASTGRGMDLVDALATRWGVSPEADGKTVWFEIGSPPLDAPAADPPGDEHPEAGAIVRLVRAPVALLRATIEYGDAVLREVAYLALAGRLDRRLPQGWRPAELDLSPVLAAVHAARPDAVHADLTFHVAPGSAAGALDRLALVEMADALAHDGALLTRPAVPEIGACRSWLLTEIASQLAGSRPVAWADPGPLRAARAPARLTPEAMVRLEFELAPVVVADDANRIIYVSDAAGALLGWSVADLVGQRLTAIIPPDLRDAHLAGFTRLQLGGAPQILDRPIAVPALHRDGTAVDIHLTVTAMAADLARTAYRATLLPAPAASPDGADGS